MRQQLRREGKTLTIELINELFDKFLYIPRKISNGSPGPGKFVDSSILEWQRYDDAAKLTAGPVAGNRSTTGPAFGSAGVRSL